MLPRPSAARPAPSPPASPPFRRPLAWSRRLWCAWWGAVAPAPAGRLSVVGLVGLAAGRALSCVRVTGWRVAFAPWRRGRGAPPAACVGGFEAFGRRGAELAVLFRGGLPPFPRRARLRALPPSPRRSHPCGVRPRAEIIAGDGGRALVPRACGAVGCARGARPCIPAVSAVCLPASGRARSACRAVCAVRALRRASPPSSGGQVRALKGFPILQREHRETGTRLRRSDRRLTAAIWPKPRKKAPALTNSGGIGRFPTPKRPAERPKMGCQRSSRRRSARYGSLWPREAT